ncbi:unnamed protein product, partial [Mesorhabditis belari]|uniref:Signal transducer and activator of transcription n=1 Tax=Mesorhabditis belari TaxID=2138241 RepID=A0AAF3JBQ3_9BILA
MYSPLSPHLNQDWRSSLSQAVNNAQLLYEETRQKQAEFINYICELQRLQGIMTQIEAEQNPEKLQKARQHIQGEQQKAAQVYESVIEKRSQSTSVLHNGMQIVLELQTELINNRLFSWKNQQRMNKIGFPHDDAEGKLDELQKEFQWLIEQIWQLRTHASYQMELMQRGPQNNNDQNSPIFAQNLSLIVEQLNNVLKTLTFHSFIVSKQPELILKTSTKFKVETRLLIGDSLGMRQNLVNTNVTVKIIAEEDAKQLAIGQSDEKNIRSIGEITNALEKITMNDKGHICAKFDNSKLMKVMARGKQQGRSSNDQKSSTATTITDQKYALLFQISSFQFESLGKMDIWCLSLPLMVTVNISQDCNVRGPILWRVAFGGTNWNQDGVDSDHAVSWANLYPVLQYQFKEFTGAKRLLNESDLRYLYEKLFNSSAINLEATINFERFARVNLHGTNFSFWDWFYSIMCLVKQKLLKYWEDGWCIGFITKQDANDILKQGPAFLLRFSDSQMGAVSIGFSTPNIPSHLAPFTTRDLDLLSISQRIATCPQLKDTIQCIMGKDGPVPKEEIVEIAKKEEQTNTQTNRSTGYVHSQIIMVIDSSGAGFDGNSPSSGGTTPSPFDSSLYSQQFSPGEIIRPNHLGDFSSMDFDSTYGDVNTLLGEFVGTWQNPPIAPNLNTPTIERLINVPQAFSPNNTNVQVDHQGNYFPNNPSTF